MNEKYVIDKIKEIEEEGTIPKEHTHTVSDISDMPSEFTPAAHGHAAADITSGTLDAARIPALTADKIPNLTADKITDLDTKISEGITGAIGDADISSFDSRITALENNISIDSSGNIVGNVVGNVTGKINLSSVSTNSNNIKVYTASCSDPSGTIPEGAQQSITITLPAGSVSRYNTGILNYTVSDASILSNMSATCTVTFYKPSGSDRTYSCVVTRNSDGATLVNSGNVSIGKGDSRSWSFTRVFNQSYTITARRVSTTSGSAVNVTTSTSTTTTTRYAP